MARRKGPFQFARRCTSYHPGGDGCTQQYRKGSPSCTCHPGQLRAHHRCVSCIHEPGIVLQDDKARA